MGIYGTQTWLSRVASYIFEPNMANHPNRYYLMYNSLHTHHALEQPIDKQGDEQRIEHLQLKGKIEL